MKKSYILMLAAIALTLSGTAQNTFNFFEKNQAAYARFGIEPTYVVAAGYMHAFGISAIRRHALVFGEVSSPTNGFGLQRYEAKLGGMLNLLQGNRFGVVYGLDFSTGHVQTKNFGSQKFAFCNSLNVGYYSNRWFLAVTSSYERIFANRIMHTEYYRDFIYPEAQDGWYQGAGGNIQLGLEGGVTLKETVDVRLALKVPNSAGFNGYNGSPGHIHLTTAFRF